MALPPGPETPGAFEILRWMMDPAGTFDRYFRRYGDLYSLNNPLLGREVVVSHPELIKQIFTGDPGVFHGGEPNAMIAVVVGDRSVLLLDGKEHHRQRKLLMPPFHGDRLDTYAEVIRRTTEQIVDGLPRGRAFSLLPSLQKITFQLILSIVFGVDSGDEIEILRTKLLSLLEKAQSPLGMVWLLPAFRRNLGPLTGWAAMKRSIEGADEVLYALIAKARRAHEAGERRKDVLSMLLSATDEAGQGMTDAELRDELITLLIAGHETTAITLAWAVEEIVRRPEVKARVLAEIAAAGPEGARRGLPYLDATIKEVLRLHPIGPLLVRKTTAPVTLRGHDLPAGTHLVINAYSAQRHPDYWEAPEEFRPDRFLSGKIDPSAWIPFGGGARRCIGMALALYETRLVLAAFLPRVELRLPDPPAKVTLRSFLFAPKGGPRVVVDAHAQDSGGTSISTTQPMASAP